MGRVREGKRGEKGGVERENSSGRRVGIRFVHYRPTYGGHQGRTHVAHAAAVTQAGRRQRQQSRPA